MATTTPAFTHTGSFTSAWNAGFATFGVKPLVVRATRKGAWIVRPVA